jgi:hypothetical protein
MGQATVLLNNRLTSIQRKCRHAVLSEAQRCEICDVADRIAGAAYHVKKWAFNLRIAGQHLKPNKPTACEDLEEALAVMRSASSWLLVCSSSVSKNLIDAVKAHGSEAETHLQKRGLQTDGLRALVPHLESCLLRLGRFMSNNFVSEHIQPIIPAELVAAVSDLFQEE